MASSSETLGELEEAQKVTDEFVALDIGDRSAGGSEENESAKDGQISQSQTDFDEICRQFFEKDHRQEMAEWAEIIRERGVSAIPEEMKKRLEKWKEIPINVGVTGNSGAGKSTFINAVRRLKPSMPGAAKTGINETTSEPKPYAHPHNPLVVFWDLPGVGTTKFPKDEYLNLVDFDKYDFFIIICSDRFTANDLWLAMEIRKGKKRFYFARTKIDRAISDDENDYPDTHSVTAVMERVRQNCKTQFSEAGFYDQDVFLICRQWDLYEFPKLEETFVLDMPVLKREVALYSVRYSSEAIVREKTKALLGRCAKVACAAVAVGMIPGFAYAIDTLIIRSETRFYKHTYSLDEESLRQVSLSSGVPMQTLIREVKQHAELADTSESIDRLLKSYSFLGENVNPMVSLLRQFFSNPVGFISIENSLKRIIYCAESVALRVIELTIAQAATIKK